MCENSHDQDKSEFVSELTVLLQSLVDEGQANNPHEARLAEFLSNQPSFSKFSGTGVIISFARGGYALDFRSLAFSLLRHASDSTPEHAVEDIQWFLETSSFPVKQSIFISGISIPEAIEMGGGIHLEPFSSIEEGANHLIPIGPSGEGLEMNIGAVLWRKIDYPKILEGPSGDAIEPDVWDFSALEDARLCLTLAGPSGPTKIGSSIFIDKWVPCVGSPLGEVPHQEECRSWPTFGKQDLQESASAHTAFLSQPTKIQNRLRVALERLNWAKRRRWQVDQAIDLGIALEVVFGSERQFDASIGFTIRVRAAHYLGNSLEERKSIAATLSALYNLRSSAVHTGVIKPKFKDQTSQSIMDIAANLISIAIRNVLQSGYPEWDDVIYADASMSPPPKCDR